jgi:hypothetical protein
MHLNDLASEVKQGVQQNGNNNIISSDEINSANSNQVWLDSDSQQSV